MEDARTQARQCLQRFTSAWLERDRGALAETLLPSVHWWSPVSPDDLTGAEPVGTHLDALLRDVEPPVTITALIVNDDGTRGVVEAVSSDGEGGRPTPLTSVIRLSGGKVADGRTYIDVRAHPSLHRTNA
jgi:hypothetical protein